MSVALAHTQQAPPPLPATVPPALRGVIARAMANGQPIARPTEPRWFAMLPPVAGGDDRAPLQAAVTAPIRVDRAGCPRPHPAGRVRPDRAGHTHRDDSGGAAPAQIALSRPAGRAGRTRRRGHRSHRVDVGGRSLTVVGAGHRHDGCAEREEPTLATTTTFATTTAAPTTTAPTPVAATVVVDPRDYLGRKADKAAKDLQGLGFEVEQEVVERGDRRPGVVVAVQPSGPLREGSTVTVVVTASGNED